MPSIDTTEGQSTSMGASSGVGQAPDPTPKESEEPTQTQETTEETTKESEEVEAAAEPDVAEVPPEPKPITVVAQVLVTFSSDNTTEVEVKGNVSPGKFENQLANIYRAIGLTQIRARTEASKHREK